MDSFLKIVMGAALTIFFVFGWLALAGLFGNTRMDGIEILSFGSISLLSAASAVWIAWIHDQEVAHE